MSFAKEHLNRLTKAVHHLFLEDHAVRYSLLARLLSIVVGPAFLFCIGTYLEPEEQGIYYVFVSLIQLGAFVDLGFSKSAQQLLANAFGSMQLQRQTGLKGNVDAVLKFSSTGKAVIKIHAILGLLLFFILGLSGTFYLEKFTNPDEFQTLLPWWCLVTATSLGFGLQSIMTLADAAKLVNFTNKWRFIAELIGIMAFIMIMVCGGDIWAIAGLAWSRVIFTLIPVLHKIGSTALKQIFALHQQSLSYREKILPLQLRNMVAYGMGFFIFYCYTPITLSYLGAVAAGIVGMSLQISNMVQNFSIIWFNTKIPLMGNLAGVQSREELIGLHSKGTKITMISWTVMSLVVILFSIFGKWIHPQFGSRYGTVFEITLFVLGSGGFVWSHIRAAFMRSYSIEPFVLLSIFQALMTLGLLWIALPLMGTTGAALCYACTMISGAFFVEIALQSFIRGNHKFSHIYKS